MKKFPACSRQNDAPLPMIVNDMGKCRVFLKSLGYAETFSRKLIFHMEQEKRVCYKSMKKISYQGAPLQIILSYWNQTGS